MQIKQQYHLSSVIWANTKRQKTVSAGENVEKGECLHTVDGIMN